MARGEETREVLEGRGDLPVARGELARDEPLEPPLSAPGVPLGRGEHERDAGREEARELDLESGLVGVAACAAAASARIECIG